MKHAERVPVALIGRQHHLDHTVLDPAEPHTQETRLRRACRGARP
jgi:hypothetical protein